MWKGLGPSLFMTIPNIALYEFLFFDFLFSRNKTLSFVFCCSFFLFLLFLFLSFLFISYLFHFRYYVLYETFLESWNNPAVSGICARSISVFFTSPFEMVRTYVQSKKESQGIVQVLERLIRGRGIKLFRINAETEKQREKRKQTKSLEIF